MRLTRKTPGRNLVLEAGELVLAVLAAVVITLVWNLPTSRGADTVEPPHGDLHGDVAVREN